MLNISQTKQAERINCNILSELYNFAKKNENETILKGYVRSEYAYRHEKTYLENIDDLDIDVTIDYYIYFEDQYCKQFWANTPIGDGTGVTETNILLLNNKWASEDPIHGLLQNNNYFGCEVNYTQVAQYDTLSKIKKFDEFKYFTTLTSNSWYNPLYYSMPNLEYITLPPGTTSSDLNNNKNLKRVDVTLCGDTITKLRYPNEANELTIVHFPPLTQPTHSSLIETPKLTDAFFYTLEPTQSESAATWFLPKNTVNIWVQDSAYDLWLTNKWGANHISQIKKFSEYTGNDLYLPWVENAKS